MLGTRITGDACPPIAFGILGKGRCQECSCA
jgi:hypothetical protein